MKGFISIASRSACSSGNTTFGITDEPRVRINIVLTVGNI
jgi:hypothetical protein